MSKTKIKMDDKTRQALMGYSVVSDSIKFTPEIEGVDAEFVPTFTIKATSVQDAKRLKEMAVANITTEAELPKKEKDKREKFLDDLTQKSIVGFTNLIDISTDTIVEYDEDDGYVSKKQYAVLPTMIKVLVMNEILRINGLV